MSGAVHVVNHFDLGAEVVGARLRVGGRDQLLTAAVEGRSLELTILEKVIR